MSFALNFGLKIMILFLLLKSYRTSPSRRQCLDLINALQLVGGVGGLDSLSLSGHISKSVKRLSLEHMPGIYADCLHADEGIRFKKSLLAHLRPIKLSRYYPVYESNYINN